MLYMFHLFNQYANSLVDDDVLVFHIYKLYIFVYLFILSTSYIQYSLCIIYRGHSQELFILFYILKEYISRSRSSSITLHILRITGYYIAKILIKNTAKNGTLLTTPYCAYSKVFLENFSDAGS